MIDPRLPACFGLLLLTCLQACDHPQPVTPTDRQQHPSTATAMGQPTPAAVIDEVKIKLDLAVLRRTIQSQQGTSGSSPLRTELEKLETNYKIGEEYSYDESTGTLSSKSRPEL